MNKNEIEQEIILTGTKDFIYVALYRDNTETLKDTLKETFKVLRNFKRYLFIITLYRQAN